MKKSTGGGSKAKPKAVTTAADHRKMADTLMAKARIHSAKADLAEALNPSKKTTRGYPC